MKYLDLDVISGDGMAKIIPGSMNVVINRTLIVFTKLIAYIINKNMPPATPHNSQIR